MCFSQNELILLTIIIVLAIYIIYHMNNCNNETFNETSQVSSEIISETPAISTETCNLNNEGFICSTSWKLFGKGYYMNKGQGCSNACVCP